MPEQFINIGMYGITDVIVHVNDHLTVEEFRRIEDLLHADGRERYAGRGEHFVFTIDSPDEDLEPLLGQLRGWDKRHAIEKWAVWPAGIEDTTIPAGDTN